MCVCVCICVANGERGRHIAGFRHLRGLYGSSCGYQKNGMEWNGVTQRAMSKCSVRVAIENGQRRASASAYALKVNEGKISRKKRREEGRERERVDGEENSRRSVNLDLQSDAVLQFVQYMYTRAALYSKSVENRYGYSTVCIYAYTSIDHFIIYGALESRHGRRDVLYSEV